MAGSPHFRSVIPDELRGWLARSSTSPSGTGETPWALELRAASVRGLSHRFAGTVRQDNYAYRRTRDGRYLVAVASDGVSNSKLSHYAADLITRHGCAELAELLEQQSPDQLA